MCSLSRGGFFHNMTQYYMIARTCTSIGEVRSLCRDILRSITCHMLLMQFSDPCTSIMECHSYGGFSYCPSLNSEPITIPGYTTFYNFKVVLRRICEASRYVLIHFINHP